MKWKFAGFVLILLVLVLLLPQAYAQSTSLMEYDTVYTVSTVDDVATMSIVFNVHNGEAESRQPLLIAVMYNNGMIEQMKTSEPSIATGASVNGEIVISIPNNKTDSYYLKLFAWESKGSLRPLGTAKTIIDIDSYLREKHIYVTANENSEFKIFMNASTAKGENDSALHTINYDASKVVPVDLCGFTYENELTACDILNTDIVIENVDMTNGIIKYKFLNNSGRNTGINNVVEFKTLTSITDAEIKYTIQ